MRISHFISENRDSFSDREKKIADKIIANKDSAIHNNIHDFSEICDVSTSSIVRFSKMVGTKGFQDLKVQLAKEGDDIQVCDITEGIKKDDSISDIARKSVLTNIDVLRITYDIIDFKVLETIVNVLKNAKTIYILGIGGSSLIAQDFQSKLIRIRKNCFHIADSHTQMILGKNISEEDAIVAISYSGETKEIVKSVSTANTKNKISITKMLPNLLEKECNYNLYVPNREGYFRLGAMTSRMCTLALIDILYLSIIIDDMDAVKEHIIESREIIK